MSTWNKPRTNKFVTMTTASGLQNDSEIGSNTKLQLEAIVESSHDAIIGKSLDGIIQSWNKGAEKMFGYSKAEMIGKSILTVIPQELKDESSIILKKIRNGQDIEDYDTVRIRKDGSKINVALSISPIYSDNSSLIGVSVVERDITKRKIAEEWMKQTQDIVDNSYDAIIGTTLDGIITSWNKGAERMFGYKKEDVIGKSGSPLFPPEMWAKVPALLNKIRTKEFVADYDIDGLRRDGTRFDLAISISPIISTNGTVVGASVVERDITLRKQTERLLLNNENNLKKVQEIAKIGSWKFDLTTKKVDWSDETYVLYERDKKLGPPTIQEEEAYYFPEDAKHLMELVRQVAETKKQASYEFPLKLPSGKNVFYISTISPVLDIGGKVTQLLGSVQDITEQKQAEEKLRKSEKRFRQTLDEMFEGCMIIDFNWTYLYVNDMAAQHGQNRKENLLGRTMLEMYPGVEKTAIFAHFRKCMEERIPQHFEEPFTFAGNVTHWYEFSVNPVEEGIFILSVEITERRKMEESLRQTQLVVDHSQDGIVAASSEGLILSWNKGAEKIYGYSAEEVIGKSPAFLFSPEKRGDIQSLIEKNNRKESVSNFETVGVRKDGTKVESSLSVSPILNEDDKVIGASIIVRDITELKKSEQAILAGIKKFEIYTNKAPIGIFVCDEKGQYTDANPEALKMSGYTKEELLRLNITDFLAPESLNEGAKAFAALNSFGFFKSDILVRKKSGEKFWINLIASKIDEHQLIAFCEDITERKQKEKRIQELNEIRNKFIDIISHQLRTPLAAVNWNLEMLLKGDFGKLEATQEKFLRATYSASLNTTSRIHDLLTAMDVEEGRVVFEKEEVSIDSIFASIINQKKKECDLKKVFCTYIPQGTKLPTIQGDADKIRLVITKLIENAIFYTKEGGTISAKLFLNGKMIRLEISDTGIGIPEPEQPRVFERFFRASNASVMLTDAFGLGLFLSKHFIEQHGGKIGFESREGVGSTFWFEIPLKQ